MRSRTFVRLGMLGLVTVGSLVLDYLLPDFFPMVRPWLLWLIPIWIALIFLVQTLTTPSSLGVTPLQVWRNRLCRRTWACPRCGRVVPLDVPLCGHCAELRDDEG